MESNDGESRLKGQMTQTWGSLPESEADCSAMREEVEVPSQALASVSNAAKILVMLQTNSSLRVVDVANSLGIGSSTAHRLLTCLKGEGFLRQPAKSRRYAAGPELLRLARNFSDQHTLERVAHPHLERLCQEVNEAVNLQVLVGSEVLCIDSVVQDRHSLQVREITGDRAPATVSAAGKLLLSVLTNSELEDLLEHAEQFGWQPEGGALASLHSELDSIRKRGYAINMGDREPGVHAVAVPVDDLGGNSIAALSVAAPSVRLPTYRVAGLARKLQAASLSLSADYFAMSRSS
jgi:DNA-binding IclR family transcriptional regulator